MKNILITGGTGTLGTHLTEKLLAENNITVLSRDEKKLVELRNKHPSVRIIVCDIRRPINVRYHLNYDTIFHCAALKHVDIGEQFPDEFFQTNYTGTKNVWDLGEKIGVNNFVFFSTDKAVLPINAYGYSKAMAEKYLRTVGNAKIYRWGNILGSRGSVLPTFIDCIRNNSPCVITDSRMTRFWLTIDEATDYVLDTYDKSDETKDGLYIHPNIKAASLLTLVDALYLLFKKEPNVVFGEIRPGEKIHECIRTGHDYCIRSDTCQQYTYDELKSKLSQYI